MAGFSLLLLVFIWNAYGGITVRQASIYQEVGQWGASCGTGLGYRLIAKWNR